jgi:hypothetical protein
MNNKLQSTEKQAVAKPDPKDRRFGRAGNVFFTCLSSCKILRIFHPALSKVTIVIINNKNNNYKPNCKCDHTLPLSAKETN